MRNLVRHPAPAETLGLSFRQKRQDGCFFGMRKQEKRPRACLGGLRPFARFPHAGAKDFGPFWKMAGDRLEMFDPLSSQALADTVEEQGFVFRCVGHIESRDEVFLMRLHPFARGDDEKERLEAETRLGHDLKPLEFEPDEMRDMHRLASRQCRADLHRQDLAVDAEKTESQSSRSLTVAQKLTSEILHEPLHDRKDCLLGDDRLEELAQA